MQKLWCCSPLTSFRHHSIDSSQCARMCQRDILGDLEAWPTCMLYLSPQLAECADCYTSLLWTVTHGTIHKVLMLVCSFVKGRCKLHNKSRNRTAWPTCNLSLCLSKISIQPRKEECIVWLRVHNTWYIPCQVQHEIGLESQMLPSLIDRLYMYAPKQ